MQDYLNLFHVFICVIRNDFEAHVTINTSDKKERFSAS